jgi:peptide/nickel transport system substrate-binding protein
MRIDQAPFNDVNVRQALRLLVDRQQLINSALDGLGVVASDVFSPYDPGFDTSLHRQQDIPQAKSLLKKAGMENMTVTLTTSAVATGMVAMATVLAEQAAAAGVTIKIHQVDSGTFFGANYLSWTFSQDYYSYALYLNQVAQSFLGSSSPFNETHSNNPHYESLYAQANATANPSTRQQIEHEMQQFDFSQGPYIIPTFMDTLDAYSDKIAGYATRSQRAVGEPLSTGTWSTSGSSVRLRRPGSPPGRPRSARVARPPRPAPGLLRLRRPGLGPGRDGREPSAWASRAGADPRHRLLRGPSQFRGTVRR